MRRGRFLSVLLLVTVAGIAVWHLHGPESRVAAPTPRPTATPVLRFPPSYAAYSGQTPRPAPSPLPARWGWLDSGNVVPAHYPRRDFEEAPDLYRLAMGVLEPARQGSAVHAYLIYLALDECRSFLRLDARSILTLYDRMLGTGSELSPHEQSMWAEQFNRCVGFAVYDWQPIGEALGEERPEVNVEYAGVWFEGAVQAGHPPALVEKAYRPGELAPGQRRELILRALASDDPEVYWLLFLQAYERDEQAAQAAALPWLRLACESGLDCRFHAPWFQVRFCTRQACEPAASSLAWFWRRLPQPAREEAQSRYRQLLEDLDAGRLASLPLPDLPADRAAPWRR